jgi:LPXTG-motif cell wall-anchored protein
MTSRILAVLGLLAALMTISGGTAVAACSCATPTPQERVSSAATVFTATAVRVHKPMLGGGDVTATLRADHVYKGAPDPEFRVSTRADGPACGYEFVAGNRYLVFATAQDSELATTLCSGNRRLPAGDRPLRLSDQTDGMEPLTPELIAALGTPTRVHAAEPATDRTGVTVISVLAGAALVAGLLWVLKRRSKS